MKKAVAIVVLLILIYLFRPFFHPLLISLWISPLKVIFFLVIVFGVWTIIKRLGKVTVVPTTPTNYTLKASNKISPLIIVGYFALIFAMVVAMFFESNVRLLLTSKQINYENRADLPVFEPVRFTPKQVAKRYADDTFQNPQEMLGDSQIAIIDNKLMRVFPRLPEGGILYFLNKLNGFVTVEVDSLDRKVDIANTQFKYSEGIGIFDNIYYRLALKKYFVSYAEEPIYLKNDQNEWVTVVPYIAYRGFPFRVPYWGGVMEVSANGTITDYTHEEASQISYYKNNRLYPKELVNYYSESYSYKGGLINLWFLHKNQIETVALPNSEKIIHVSTNEGFKQLVVAEPYGSSYGIYKIFLFDATTGKREIIEYDQNSQLTGPVAAADYIKREFPTYSWDTFLLAEPRPLKIKGDLFWLLSIIPDDSAGIAKTVLFNAKTNKVTGVDNVSEFEQFYQTGTLDATPITDQPTPDTIDKTANLKQKIDAIQKELNDLKDEL